ncbi:hypothetical protein [Streptomyces sp. NPDC017964]|uniref:hypothetical protein n=1 Tax=Streptomyces sp. NPDC017964 TaxID=3365022 RepID=UPI0037878908
MLLRAILDHIPPVFGQRNFQHVVAPGPWGRSEKVYMKQLTEFRASADDAPADRYSDQPLQHG